MPRYPYVPHKFHGQTAQVIAAADQICREYEAQGFTLTLRQLFYQFVARDLIPNSQKSYKRLGDILNNARLAGLLDWNHMIDRTRSLRGLGHWDDPSDIIEASASSFRVDLWANQEHYVEVWIEKDALVGVIDPICGELDVPYFSCRGYTSQSELWRGGMRLASHMRAGKSVRIIHLGDHDPSGIDMTRDIEERIRMFAFEHDDFPEDQLEINRIALNRDQIDQYSPPPNPAKLTDSRAGKYIQRHGRSSWELDALEPTVIAGLIRGPIEELIDQEQWAIDKQRIDDGRETLNLVADNWDEVAPFAKDRDGYLDQAFSPKREYYELAIKGMLHEHEIDIETASRKARESLLEQIVTHADMHNMAIISQGDGIGDPRYISIRDFIRGLA